MMINVCGRGRCSLWKTVHGRRVAHGHGPRLANRTQRADGFQLQICHLHIPSVGKRRQRLPMAPISLAFTLNCLESVVNEASPERENADLLWVATGGGKTEAYL